MSSCSSLAVRTYFRDGILPRPGAVCEMDVDLFGNIISNASHYARRDELMSVLRNITMKAKIKWLPSP